MEAKEEFNKQLKNLVEQGKAIVYVDESGVCSGSTYEHGWSKKGERLPGVKSGKRGERVNIIAAYSDSKLFAPFVFEGTCDTHLFEGYVRQVLLPALSENSVLVLDNASFHRKSDVEEILKDKDCTVLWLPPYSPELNRIENQWHMLKTTIRKAVYRTQEVFGDIIDAAMRQYCCYQPI